MEEPSGNKKILAGMIIVGVLILASVGTLLGMKIGNSRRQQISEAQASQAAEYSKELADSEAAADASASAAEASKAAEESETAQKAEQDQAAKVLEEQTKAANRENAEIIKGAVSAAIPNVSAYADAVKNAETISAVTITPLPESAATVSAESAASTVTTSSAAQSQTGSKGIIVCIDPGHETSEITDKEPNAPGSDVMKQKVSSGTYGDASGKNEYEVNLQVSMKLKALLEERGYTVVMTRTTNDVTLSNVDRAKIATAAGANIFIRIHCNGVDDSSVKGVLCYEPSSSNPYLSSEVIAGSQRLATLLRDNQCAVTGQRAIDNLTGDDMTGINWATMPVSIVEMGFMSNSDEDLFLASDTGQNEIAQGLANGVDAYFAG